MSSTEEFNCVFCKQSFDNKEELQIHFRKHGDPKFNESLKNKHVPNDVPISSDKSNDASEMVSCDVCDDVFPTISKAITHKHKVHPDHDAKYFCPWCGKLFTMKHLYNKHLQSNHNTMVEKPDKEDSNFRCDTCIVYFFVPSAMVYHNKFFHRQDDLPVIGHSKKQKLFDQDLLPVYYCSFCGEEYINKVNLHKHITDDHGDENQRPSDVLRCPLCEAIFYHLDAYELHLMFHSSGDLYVETNEMNETDLPEFSLETVPPVMEKVEDMNSLQGDNSINAIGIESFLQMAMDEPVDNGKGEELPERTKSKKHKKHKKSKKAAITLDEFLSMNQDVFGEGIDFQGIEEVPTQVIKKQFRAKKLQPVMGSKSAVSSADLKKLQMQGIVVKRKPGNKPMTIQGKIPTKVLNPQVMKTAIKTKTNAIQASNKVLAKLMNQSSNQLKIVKRPTQGNTNSEHEKTQALNESKEVSDSHPGSPEDIETECGDIGENEDFEASNSESITTSNIGRKSKSPEQIVCTPDSINNEQPVNDVDDITENNVPINTDNNTNTNDSLSLPDVKQNDNSPCNKMANALKSISKHITIKSINKPTTSNSEDDPVSPDLNKNDLLDRQDSDAECNTQRNQESITNKTVDSLKIFKNANTVKPVNSNILPVSTYGAHTNVRNEKSGQIAKPDSESNDDTGQDEPEFDIQNDFPTDTHEHHEKKEHNSKTSEVLKNLSKNIVIKSIPSSKNSIEIADDNKKNTNEEPTQNLHKGVKPSPNRQDTMSSDIKNEPTSHSPHSKNIEIQKSKSNHETDNGSISTIQTNNNLLKNLKNITAKPLSVKNVTQQMNINTSNKAVNVIKGTNVQNQNIQKKDVEEIEIFSIDDSDSDDASQVEPTPTKTINPINTTAKNNQLNALKNFRKPVTVKPIKIEVQKNDTEDEEELDNDSYMDDSNKLTRNTKAPDVNKPILPQKANNQKDESLKSVLKNLSKHITIKSRNSSPSPSIKSLETQSEEMDPDIQANDSDDDEDSCSGKVKITEVTEDDIADEDAAENNTGIVTQSPNNSDDDDFDKEAEDQWSDTESQISQKPNMAKNNTKINFNSNSLSSLKIGKNVMVKPLNQSNVEDDEPDDEPETESVVYPHNLGKELSIRPVKQPKPLPQNESIRPPQNNSSIRNVGGTRFVNPSTMNQRNIRPQGQVNTVNKEVKVKSYQSQTVIEEITTTVTKTIRTVNQSTKQVYNANQTASFPRQAPPKNVPRMGYQPSRNFEGVTVRQPPPMASSKIRNATSFRPVVGTSIRHVNQQVPVRPANQLVPIRQVRPSIRPRMPVKKSPTQPTQQRPGIRPLKISPNVLNQTFKKPDTDDTSGPFSCFKKPKESLIPNATSNEDSSEFQYASSSQINKFSSVTKTVKGNSVVSSTQKAESSSQQQISNRLGNVAGLKIMKTKQVSKEETSEVSAAKRTALEAIEKLQKQGLLVKKPRVDEECDQNNSDGDDDDDFNAMDDDDDDDDF